MLSSSGKEGTKPFRNTSPFDGITTLLGSRIQKTIITEGDSKKAVDVLNNKMLLFERGRSNGGRLSLKQFHSDGLKGRQTK